MKSKPRVLLFSASSGAGHVRAAQAARQMARPNAAANIAAEALGLVD